MTAGHLDMAGGTQRQLDADGFHDQPVDARQPAIVAIWVDALDVIATIIKEGTPGI